MFERFRRSEREREARQQQGAAATAERDQTAAPPPPPPADRAPEGEHTVAERRFERAEHGNGGHTATAAATAPAAASTREVVHDLRARQRAEFGGFNIGAAFFGWLVAVGLGALLTALLVAAGTAIGLTEGVGSADEIGIGGGVLFICALLIAYFAGGYVAGRMSRFDGGRQGLGVWLFALLATVIIGGLGAIAGSEYNLFEQLNLPRIPVDEGDLTTGGIIALAAILLGTLLAAIFGGKVGERYHRRIDRYGAFERDRALTH
jgi:hypothetical protein